MRRFWAILSYLICVIITTLSAQERDGYFSFDLDSSVEAEQIIEVDTTLFRSPPTFGLDTYAQATRYYRAQGAQRRRGLYYTKAAAVVEPLEEYFKILEEPLPQSKITLYAAQSSYRAGLRASHAQLLDRGWSLSSSLWAQTGRDLFVEGLFRNTIAPEFVASKRFEEQHYLSISGSLYGSSQGLQYGSTSEVFELVGTNYYNPAWGLYNGKVRNSRVRSILSPDLSLHYQLPLDSQRSLIVESRAAYSRNATSSLGWYNATTPTPDYYSKLPSALPSGEIQDYVTNLWRTNDIDYTQINWDELIRLNTISTDGNARYVVEDRVKKLLDCQVAALIHSELSGRLTLTYGAEFALERSRNYKELDDLLGATYLMDYDQFMGDYYNKTLPLQNNLLNPDNKVVEGERFGYDYSLSRSVVTAILRVSYRAERFDLNLESSISGEQLYRIGHFEKERFADAASLGSSTKVEGAPYNIRLTCGYPLSPLLYIALKVVASQQPLETGSILLNETASNYLAPSLTAEQINSAAVNFRFNSSKLTLNAEFYALSSRHGSSIYSAYDDLSSTMCRAMISEIGYSSYGVELTAEMRLDRDLRITSTLAAGRYLYDKNPYVELFDDYDLTTISSPTRSQMSGLSIGNTPQVSATASLTYFGLESCIINLSTSYAALRYEEPSTLRRSERLLAQAFLSDESRAEALSQERLDDIFDVEISISRYFRVADSGQLSIRMSVKNLLGDSERVYYARESNRVSLQSVDGYFSGSMPHQSSYQYSAPRCLQLSVGYRF